MMLPGRGARTRENKPLEWRGILEIAYGELGMVPWEFDEYSMSEFVFKVEGSRKKDMDTWRHTRALAYMTALPHLKKKVSQEQFWPLPGDAGFNKRKSSVAQMTAEEKKEYVSKVRQHLINQGLVNNN